MGAEKGLGHELVAAVAGRQLPSTLHRREGVGLVHYFDGLGSQNIPLMSHAVRLWLGIPGAVEAWLSIFEAGRRQWMGSELGSRIYGTWHMASILAVYAWARRHGHRELKEAAGGWLLHWWCLMALIEAPDGQLLMVGMRSAGHVPHPGLAEWLYNAALGDQQGMRWAEAQSRRWRLGLRQKWEWQLAQLLMTDLRLSALPLVSFSPTPRVAAPVVMPFYGLRSGIEILRTTEGLAVWIDDADGDSDDNDNSNTAPVMGAVWSQGKAQWLPPSGGERIRQRRDRATCRRDGDRLVYRSTFHGEHSLPLPGGEVLQALRLPRGNSGTMSADNANTEEGVTDGLSNALRTFDRSGGKRGLPR